MQVKQIVGEMGFTGWVFGVDELDPPQRISYKDFVYPLRLTARLVGDRAPDDLPELVTALVSARASKHDILSGVIQMMAQAYEWVGEIIWDFGTFTFPKDPLGDFSTGCWPILDYRQLDD